LTWGGTIDSSFLSSIDATMKICSRYLLKLDDRSE